METNTTTNTELQIPEVSEKLRGKGVPFERIRRITGYLVGDMKRWGTSKRSEEADRVKHTL